MVVMPLKDSWCLSGARKLCRDWYVGAEARLGPGGQVGEGLVHSGGGDEDFALRGIDGVLLVCKGLWRFI